MTNSVYQKAFWWLSALMPLLIAHCVDTGTSTPPEPSLRIFEPSGGETYGPNDTVIIRVGFKSDMISAAVVSFSRNSGLSFDIITAEKLSSDSGVYYIDIYKWVPSDDSIVDGEILLQAHDYGNSSLSAILSRPISIKE